LARLERHAMNEKNNRELLDLRLVMGQFCDDIRLEVGHKLSFIGCYNDEMIVQSFPSTLPKLAVQAKALTPLRCPFKRLTFKLNLQSNTVAQLEADTAALNQVNARAAQGADARWIWIAAVMIVSPLVVAEACELTLTAETESGPVRGSILRIRSASSIAPEKIKSSTPRIKRKRRSNQ
jgi:hypothetical protein